MNCLRPTGITMMLTMMLAVLLLAQVSPVAFSDAREVVPGFDSAGPITLTAARLKLDIVYPQRQNEQRCELTVVYDSKTGHFLWHNIAIAPSLPVNEGHRLKMIREERVVIFADPAGLIDFEFGSFLFVKVWRGRAKSLAEAVSKATNEIQQGLPVFAGVGFHREYRLVPIFGPLRGFEAKIPAGYKPIPREFYCEPFNAICAAYDNRIVSVSKQGDNWRLVLRNRFDAEVILDQNLDLVSTRQLTQPKK